MRPAADCGYNATLRPTRLALRLVVLIQWDTADNEALVYGFPFSTV
jgi:hypothetical protein